MGLEDNIVKVPGKRRAGSNAGGSQEGLTLDLLMEGLTEHREDGMEKENTGTRGDKEDDRTPAAE